MEDKINLNEKISKEHKRASKVIFALGIILAVVLVFSLITSIVLLLFPVTEIEVVGDSRYDYSKVIEASGIEDGDRLYYLNKDKAEKAILSALPYIKDVKINSYFPNRVKIEIEEFEDVYLVAHTSGFCYVNGEFEILEVVENAPTYERFSGVFIKLESPLDGAVGTISDREDTKRANELISYIKEYGFYKYLNIVDVKNKYDNAFVVGKKYKFVLGAMTDIEEKIEVSYKVCFRDDFDQEKNGIIDATDKKKVLLRYVNDEKIRSEFDFCQK